MSEVFQNFVQMIVIALVAAYLPKIVESITGLLSTIVILGRQKIDPTTLATIDAIVAMAVKAAEQSGLKDEIIKTGEQKKQEAIQIIQNALNARGLRYINVTEIEARIEAAIHDGLQVKLPDEKPEVVVTQNVNA